jgi:hypothetical protein
VAEAAYKLCCTLTTTPSESRYFIILELVPGVVIMTPHFPAGFFSGLKDKSKSATLIRMGFNLDGCWRYGHGLGKGHLLSNF